MGSAPHGDSAIGHGLEKTDQVISSELIDCSGAGFDHWNVEIPLNKHNTHRPAKRHVDILLDSSDQRVEVGQKLR